MRQVTREIERGHITTIRRKILLLRKGKYHINLVTFKIGVAAARNEALLLTTTYNEPYCILQAQYY